METAPNLDLSTKHKTTVTAYKMLQNPMTVAWENLFRRLITQYCTVFQKHTQAVKNKPEQKPFMEARGPIESLF